LPEVSLEYLKPKHLRGFKVQRSVLKNYLRELEPRLAPGDKAELHLLLQRIEADDLEARRLIVEFLVSAEIAKIKSLPAPLSEAMEMRLLRAHFVRLSMTKN
jgi:hypothetical protein